MFTNIRAGSGLLAIAAVTLTLGGCGGGGGGGSTAGGTTGTTSVETVLYSFVGSPDGSSPSDFTNLVEASDHYLYGTTSGGTYGKGAVIKISMSGQESVLYSFGATATDASTPQSGLIQASDGYLYGTSLNGGANGKGAVFKVNTTTGQETVVYSFGASGTDGAQPVGSLLEVGSGTLYGATASGGANSAGTVFEVNTTTGQETVVYSFGAAGDGVSPADGLVQGGNGYLYGLASGGGANAYGAVYRITTSTGAETVLYSFGNNASDGTNPTPTGRLILGKSGALYGALQFGGLYGKGAIFSVTTSGVESLVLNFSGSPGDGDNPFGGVVQASDGYFYGVTAFGGSNGTGVAYKVDAFGNETILYNFGTTAGDATTPAGNLIQASDGHLYGMSSTGGANGTGTVFRIN